MAKMAEYLTKTGDWMLAIHRVSPSTAEIWFGTLCPTLKMPDQARLVLTDHAGGPVATLAITRANWLRPFDRLKQRFFYVHQFTGLQPATHYRVRFDRLLPPEAAMGDNVWQDVCSGEFSTLPTALPIEGSGVFTVGLGSCFYNHRDGGAAASAYRKLYNDGLPEVRPVLKFLAGDQVYLDIGMDSISLDGDEIRERIASDYERNWRLLGDILRHGGTWMLPDDHEFWNDYPFYDTPLPTLWPLQADHVRKAWVGAARDAISNIQRCATVETFSIGQDLAFCVADLRSRRHKNGFIDEPGLQQMERWAAELTCPGVLVIPQNLFDTPEGSEKNLTDFRDQYTRLINALASSGHDIVVMTGDVHFGRVAQAPLGPNGARIIEVASSPLSNLTGLNGIATAVASKTPRRFPPYNGGQLIQYDRKYFVSKENGDLLGAYPRRRTREHFMTASFARGNDGIKMSIDAWLVRKSGAKGLPKRDFKESFVTVLK